MDTNRSKPIQIRSKPIQIRSEPIQIDLNGYKSNRLNTNSIRTNTNRSEKIQIDPNGYKSNHGEYKSIRTTQIDPKNYEGMQCKSIRMSANRTVEGDKISSLIDPAAAAELIPIE
jgi:hypothetical protein